MFAFLVWALFKILQYSGSPGMVDIMISWYLDNLRKLQLFLWQDWFWMMGIYFWQNTTNKLYYNLGLRTSWIKQKGCPSKTYFQFYSILTNKHISMIKMKYPIFYTYLFIIFLITVVQELYRLLQPLSHFSKDIP